MSITLLANIDIGIEGEAAITQLAGFDFNSYADFGNGRYIAGHTGGLYEIGGSGTHIGLPESRFTTFKIKMGYDGPKRLRFLYLGVDTQGSLKITPIAEDTELSAITVTPRSTGRQLIRVPVPRSFSHSLYWSFVVENVDGCWFSIDFMKALPIKLNIGLCA